MDYFVTSQAFVFLQVHHTLCQRHFKVLTIRILDKKHSLGLSGFPGTGEMQEGSQGQRGKQGIAAALFLLRLDQAPIFNISIFNFAE